MKPYPTEKGPEKGGVYEFQDPPSQGEVLQGVGLRQKRPSFRGWKEALFVQGEDGGNCIR